VLDDLLTRLEAQLDDLVEVAATTIFTQIPAYAAQLSPTLQGDVREHVREHISATLTWLRGGEEVTPEDLLFIRRHAAQRVGRLSVADFIRAFQIGQRVLWAAAVSLATDDPSRRAVLGVVGNINSYFEVAITHAAEVYLEAEQLLGAAGERLRRDTLEDLLAGVTIDPGAREQTVRDAGLLLDSHCLVISAKPVTALLDAHALRNAASRLARVTQQATAPLSVIRHDEIVIVAAIRQQDLGGIAERLAATQARLADREIPLTVGMSTVHEGRAAIPAAYREAGEARAMLGGNAGTVALPAMTAFGYIVRQSGPTAQRLLAPALTAFVAEDHANGGTLLDTLRAYADADLNVKRAAEQLQIHVNTAHYRLAKVEERTGVDLRRINDVIELLIAAQLREHA
jgi:hypothetical protein